MYMHRFRQREGERLFGVNLLEEQIQNDINEQCETITSGYNVVILLLNYCFIFVIIAVTLLSYCCSIVVMLLSYCCYFITPGQETILERAILYKFPIISNFESKFCDS